MNKQVNILGVRFDNESNQSARQKISQWLDETGLKKIYTPNPEIVMMADKNPEFKEVLNRGDLIIADGIGVIYASRIGKKPLQERVTGYDTSIYLIEEAQRKGLSLYIMGGAKGVADKACENLRKDYPRLKIAGCHHGYYKGAHIGHAGHEEEQAVVKDINDSGADILFVCLGAVKQEQWIEANASQLNCKIAIGNGGTVDGLAGNLKRAPEFFQKANLEWFYRLVCEPSRIKRQIVLPLFMLKVIFNKKAVQ